MINTPGYDPVVDFNTTILVILFWVAAGVFLYIRSHKKERRKRNIDDLWRRFARGKDLTEEKYDASLYWYRHFRNFNHKTLSKTLSEDLEEFKFQDPYVHSKPGRGNISFKGRNRNFPCALETINDPCDEGESELYTRISLELPGIPKDFILRPKAAMVLAFARLISHREKEFHVESFEREFLVKGGSTNVIQTFLTDDHKRAIVDFSNDYDGLRIQDGKLFCIRKGQVDDLFELDQLYSRIGELGWILSKR